MLVVVEPCSNPPVPVLDNASSLIVTLETAPDAGQNTAEKPIGVGHIKSERTVLVLHCFDATLCD